MILSLLKDGAVVDAVNEGDIVAIVVNQTPFYGESGGQMGDTGTISGEGFAVEVTDTQVWHRPHEVVAAVRAARQRLLTSA